MNDALLRTLLSAVEAAELSIDDAVARIRDDMNPLAVRTDDAVVDIDRVDRCGMPEVVYCASKNVAQIAEVMAVLYDRHGMALGTRCAPDKGEELSIRFPDAVYDPLARTIRVGGPPVRTGRLATSVVTAGTSDKGVAEEAAVTLEAFGYPVVRHYDVGVAGLHRLLDRRDAIEREGVTIVVAGMEGALPSVVGGLVSRPVIAVPTSVGYGAAREGMTALFAMLTSCAAGLTVVNIDNGFGAAAAAMRIYSLIDGARGSGKSAADSRDHLSTVQ
jgi:NCAIR mutase (PurE)-related protein